MNNENGKDIRVEIEETEVTECDSAEVAPIADKQDRFSSFKHGMMQFGKKTSEISQKAATTIAEQTKIGLHNQKMKKYNPLFPKEFKSKSFNLPNVIKIVDDAERRGIDVCEGAIGWRNTVGGVEVLFLYDEFVASSHLLFLPIAKCDTIYCVDPFDRSRFIQADTMFSRTNQEKLAELENIAYCLGAKSCAIELVDMSADSEKSSQKAGIKASEYAAVSAQQNSASLNKSMQRSKTTSSFEGSNTPTRPALKWFAHDDTMNQLIEMRCSGNNSIKSRVLELKNSCSATMSQSTAVAIDKLAKVKIGGSATMEKQAVKEQNSVLIFEIEF